jgi:hypothetical protein
MPHKPVVGGRHHTADGYIEVSIFEDSPFFPMANYRYYVMEHRLVMAEHLGRCLETWEVVHHINSIKDDNRIENLELIGCQGRHNTHTEQTLISQSKQIKELQERVTLLEGELTLLKSVGQLSLF